MVYIEDKLEHEVAELICLKCFNRWIGVYLSKTPLNQLECKCGEIGYVIKTGQTLPDIDAENFEHDKRYQNMVRMWDGSMSIIIKTMSDLPEHCYDCPCHDGESSYCQADKEHRYSFDRPFWCPLVKISNEKVRINNETMQ